jgi:hypothetical protein
MTQISSEPAHNAATLNDEVTLALRAITEKRAATIGYLLDESRQRISRMILRVKPYATMAAISGISCVRKCAIARICRSLPGCLPAVWNLRFMRWSPLAPAGLNLSSCFTTVLTSTAGGSGAGASEIETLCDICMEGDHALTDAFPGLRLEVQTALARGDAACRLRFYQSESHEAEWQP